MSYKLCFLKGDDAYFTSASLDDIWGDDWDDAPYEHNAGRPYEYATHRNCDPYTNLHVKFEIHAFQREPRHGERNSPYSVEDISNQEVPWISVGGGEDKLFAGTVFQEFCKFVKAYDGEVYLPSGYIRGTLQEAIKSVHREKQT